MILTTKTPKCYLYDVYLNGIKQDARFVREANEEAGYVQFLDMTELPGGGFRIQRNAQLEIKTYMLRGIVKCVLRETVLVSGASSSGLQAEIKTDY